MKRFRSSRLVKNVALEVEARAREQSNAIWGVSYTHDEDGYIILVYHGRLSKKVDKISNWYGYRVQWVPTKKPEPA